MRRELVVSAEDINEAHRLAQSSAEAAVEHALKCGRLLLAMKKKTGHGQWQSWIEENCSFGYSTAARYMTAAKSNARGAAFSSLRDLFPSSKSAPRKIEFIGKSITSPQISTAVEISKPSKSEQLAAAKSRPAPEPEMPQDGFEPEADEEARLEAFEKEYTASIDKVMGADDKLAAAHAEIKRQAAEIAALKISRDGYMNQCGELVRRIKGLQRKLAQAEKSAA